MTPQEQAAFAKAYQRHIGVIRIEEVADTVQRHYAGEDIQHTRGYNSILDALGMWHEGAKWQLTKGQA